MNKLQVIETFQEIMKCSADIEMNKICSMKDCDTCVHYVSRNCMIGAMKYAVKTFNK